MARMGSHHHCGLGRHSATRIGIPRISFLGSLVPSSPRVCDHGIAYLGLLSSSSCDRQCSCSDGQGGRNGGWSPCVKSLLSFLPIERKAIWYYLFSCWVHWWVSRYMWFVLLLVESFERWARCTRNTAAANSSKDVDLASRKLHIPRGQRKKRLSCYALY
jgi:hypothetical protein